MPKLIVVEMYGVEMNREPKVMDDPDNECKQIHIPSASY